MPHEVIVENLKLNLLNKTGQGSYLNQQKYPYEPPRRTKCASTNQIQQLNRFLLAPTDCIVNIVIFIGLRSETPKKASKKKKINPFN